MELPAVESVLRGVSHQTAEKRICIKRRKDLLEIETAALFEDPGDLPDPQIPLFQMMYDSKIEYRVETSVPVWKILGIGYEEIGPLQDRTRRFPKGSADHKRIDVYGLDMSGMEVFANESYAVPSSAADFKTAAASVHGPHSSEVPGFQGLDKLSHRAVHPHSFRPVDFHIEP